MTCITQPGHVLVIGSLNADLVMRAARLPRVGETIIGGTFQLVPGGKGANQAVAAARLGAATHLIGCVGDDVFGTLVVAAVAEAGVGVDAVRVAADIATGTANVNVDAQGQNAIIVASGANARLTPDDVVHAVAAWEQATLVVLQLEIPLVTVATSIALAAERHLPVVLNAAPTQQLPEDLWHAVDWLVVNEVEAEQLAGRTVGSVREAAAIARALRCGRQRVVVTLGAAGALLVDGDNVVHVPAPAVRVVDTTAAGDAFVGGLAAGVHRGLTPIDAVSLGVAAGTLACTRNGAIPSLPTAADVSRVLVPAARGW